MVCTSADRYEEPSFSGRSSFRALIKLFCVCFRHDEIRFLLRMNKKIGVRSAQFIDLCHLDHVIEAKSENTTTQTGLLFELPECANMLFVCDRKAACITCVCDCKLGKAFTAVRAL